MHARTDTPGWIAAILSWPWLLPAARLALVSAFLIGGVQKLVDFPAAVAEQAHFGLQPAWLWAAAAIVVELGGSVLVIAGRWVWLGSGGLGVLTAVSLLIANSFWAQTGHDRFMATNAFFEHLGLIAGLVIVSICTEETRLVETAFRSPISLEELSMKRISASILLLSVAAFAAAVPAIARDARNAGSETVAVAPQYDTTHVYVAPEDVDKFVSSFLATFGGQSTKQVVATVTPMPSSTTSQLLQTPAGTVSLFGFKTPVPYPFGAERNGYLVSDIDAAIKAARDAGADVIVATFPDPIGRDAVIQWPGGVNMQLYWHTTKPNYAPFEKIPENRVYVSADRADAFVRSFVTFSRGKIVSQTAKAPGIEIGRAGQTYRRIRIESAFGKMVVLVTDGHLPYPYGRETTGYEVADLSATLAKAKVAGASVVVEPYTSDGRSTAIVEFPGGYVAEIHSRENRHAARP